MRKDWRAAGGPSAVHAGVSLVEILIGLLISSIGILVMLNLFAFAEGQKRTTTSGSDAQVNGQMALLALERDTRMAGYGLALSTCTTIRAYNENATPQTFTLTALPVLLTNEDGNRDKVQVTYSNSGFAAFPAVIQKNMPDSSAELSVNFGTGFAQGNLVLLSQPGGSECTLVQLSQDSQPVGTANVTGPGTQWRLQHNPGSGYVYNPPGGQSIFPAGGYTIGSQAFNMGAMVVREYYVANGKLMMRDPLNPGVAALELVDGVVALRAYYGRDANGDGDLDGADTDGDGIVDSDFDTTAPGSPAELLAVKLAIVVRGSAHDRNYTAPATIALWPGGPTVSTSTFALDEPEHYRYRVYSSVVPLKNVIWNN